MRVVKIAPVQKSCKQFHVYLSGAHRYDFTNKKKAEAFCRKLEDILNVHLRSANVLFSAAFSQFRHLYFYIDNSSECLHLQNSINQIETQFSLILSSRYSESSNGPSFIFEKLQYVFRELQSVFRNLYAIADQKRQITVKTACDVNLRYLKSDQHSLLNLQNQIFTTYQIRTDYELSIAS